MGVLLVASVSGAVYQSCSVRREAARFPPPGRLVDIGGRNLHVVCIGEGQPTVIFEPSGFGGALSSEAARKEISAHTRVCSYDRMGFGWSDPGPPVISVGQLAGDLERLLDRAGIAPPYVLVPASIGGLTSELFARRHPDRVAGLVLLDAALSDALGRIASRQNWLVTTAACSLPLAARIGLIRLVDPLGLRRVPSPGAERTLARLYRPEPMSTMCGLVRGASQTLQEFRAAPPLPSDIRLTVLIAETNKGLAPLGLRVFTISVEDRQNVMKAFSRRSSRGTWQIVPGSDHLIGGSQPHAVASAVLGMVAEIRSKAR